MLQDLDDTLETLLKRELPPEWFPEDGGTEVKISFTTPDNDSIGEKPAINLFLYEVRENMELSSREWSIAPNGRNDKATKRPPPARVDCSYMITFWPEDPTNVREEHEGLGEVMKVLLRYPKIPAEVLQGSLEGQDPPPAQALRPGQQQSLGEFWQAMGGKPKAALNYTVTVSVQVDETVEEVYLVKEKIIELKKN